VEILESAASALDDASRNRAFKLEFTFGLTSVVVAQLSESSSEVADFSVFHFVLVSVKETESNFRVLISVAELLVCEFHRTKCVVKFINEVFTLIEFSCSTSSRTTSMNFKEVSSREIALHHVAAGR
jgi:hypothetical protein